MLEAFLEEFGLGFGEQFPARRNSSILEIIGNMMRTL